MSEKSLKEFFGGGGSDATVEDAVRDKMLIKLRKNSSKMVLFRRLTSSVAALVADLEMPAVEKSLARDTGIEGLLAALAASESVELPAFGKAIIRGIAAKRELLAAEGGTLTAQQLAQAYGNTKGHYLAQRASGKLVAVQLGSNRYRFPIWQFDEKGHVLDGLDQVLAALSRPSIDDWSQFIFFLEPHDALAKMPDEDITPLEALRAGRVDDVVRAARAWGP